MDARRRYHGHCIMEKFLLGLGIYGSREMDLSLITSFLLCLIGGSSFRVILLCLIGGSSLRVITSCCCLDLMRQINL